MNVLEGIIGLQNLAPGAIISVGNFDGLHLGHARILETMRSLRDASGPQRLAVVTFEPHPLTVLRPHLAPPRLTPPALKKQLLERAGVDDYIVLPPSREILNLSAEQFWAILRDDVRPSHLIEGSSFNFGKDRRGTIDRLREWSALSNVQLTVIDPVSVPLLDLSIVPVSSSLIRWLIAFGRVRDAAICLGRPYQLQGTVVGGHERGRTIGTPTVNLDCADQLIPADGVYAGRCTIAGQTFPAAVSIGNSPTFENAKWQLEAHLIGFTGDLYGQTIDLEMLDWLREQRRYADIDSLKNQIARDIDNCRQTSEIDPSRPIAAMTI